LEENTAEEYNSFRPLSLILFQVAADKKWFDLIWIIPIVLAAAIAVIFLVLRQRGYWEDNAE